MLLCHFVDVVIVVVGCIVFVVFVCAVVVFVAVAVVVFVAVIVFVFAIVCLSSLSTSFRSCCSHCLSFFHPL